MGVSGGSVPWAILACCSAAYLCISVGGDAIRSLQMPLHAWLSDGQLGALYGVYGLAATLGVLSGGLLLDRLGRRRATALFAALAVAGMGLQTFALHFQLFPALLIGRFIQGLAESLFIAWDAFLTTHWPGARLPLAMGLYCACGRLGDLLAVFLLPALTLPLPTVALIVWCIVSAGGLFCALLIFLDWRDHQRRQAEEAASKTSSDNVSLLENHDDAVNTAPAASSSLLDRVKAFPWSYWFAVALSCTGYGGILLLLQFAPTVLYQERVITSKLWASYVVAPTYVTSLVLTPLLGYVFSKRVHWRFRGMFVSAVLLLIAALACFPIHAVVSLVGMVCLGGCYALMSSGLWGTLGMYCNETNMGLAFGIPYALYNMTIMLFSFVSGLTLENWPMWASVMIWSILSAIGVVCSLLWSFFGRREASMLQETSERGSVVVSVANDSLDPMELDDMSRV